MGQAEIWRELARDYSLIRLNGKIPIEKEWQQWCHTKRPFESIGVCKGDNVGIACGPASGIIVLDIDEPELFERTCKSRRWTVPITRSHKTGSGKFHALYRYPSDRVYGNKGLKEKYGFDVRGVGGQIVAPGSIHPDTGKPYTIINDGPLEDPPDWLLNLYSTEPSNGSSAGMDVDSILSGVPKGERDETLFRYACRLRQQGIGILEAKVLLETAARRCDPPFSVMVALQKVEQAWAKYAAGDSGVQEGTITCKGGEWGFEETVGGQQGDNRGDKSGDKSEDKSEDQTAKGLGALVETYLINFTGNFSTRDLSEYIQSHLGIEKLPRSHQKALAKILTRHIGAKRLERTVRGGYRIVDENLEDLDLGEGADEHKIKLPLRLNELVRVEPKEIIMVCGNSDAGKTCFAFQVGLLNKIHTYRKEELGAGGFGVYHFVSEMGGVSFRNKLNSFGDGAYEEYRSRVRVLRFKAESIQDQIQPNSVNIIDYLEPASGDFREIVPTINKIFDKLITGVAVICVQMRDQYPVGGQGVFWRPRLAVGLLNVQERNCKVAKIFKGKNHRSDTAIDNWELDYWVCNRGTKFQELSEWSSPFNSKRKAYAKI